MESKYLVVQTGTSRTSVREPSADICDSVNERQTSILHTPRLPATNPRRTKKTKSKKNHAGPTETDGFPYKTRYTRFAPSIAPASGPFLPCSQKAKSKIVPGCVENNLHLEWLIITMQSRSIEIFYSSSFFVKHVRFREIRDTALKT